jgi:murein DD-endopeptidase MepM/ murein hydrolase activator NlpD
VSGPMQAGYTGGVRPFVRAAVLAAIALVVARLAERGLAETETATPTESSAKLAALEVPCPAGSLPDDGACIPVPLGTVRGGPALEATRDEHRDRLGRLQQYDHIPLRPERASDYRRYRLPIPVPATGPLVSSGHDRHLPDSEQRRGANLGEVGHGGVDLGAPRGTAVRAVSLEHQTDPSSLLFAGDLFGTTVVTHHRVREGAGVREYLVLYGHLERAAATLKPGETVAPDAIIGFVGDTGSPGAVHLHLEVRRVRDGIRVRELGPRELVHDARTIAVDPRNVLEPIRGQPAPP